MDDDDERLVERIRRGDGEAFGVLYDRTREWLLACVIAPRVGRALAEDVLADTYETALEKVHGFEWRGVGLLHWLAAIARRKSLERIRQGCRMNAQVQPLSDLFDAPDGAPTAEAELIRVETLAALRGRVEAALRELPSRYAEALRLRLLDGRSRAECAERLAVTVATFDVVLYRATRAFQKKWKDA